MKVGHRAPVALLAFLAIALALAIGLPLAGLYLSGRASRQVERIVAVRDVATSIDQSLTDIAVAVRTYETSAPDAAGRNVEDQSSARSIGVELQQVLAGARALDDVPTEFVGPLEEMIAAGERYLMIVNERLNALAREDPSPEISRRSALTRGESLQASVKFSSAAHALSGIQDLCAIRV